MILITTLHILLATTSRAENVGHIDVVSPDTTDWTSNKVGMLNEESMIILLKRPSITTLTDQYILPWATMSVLFCAAAAAVNLCFSSASNSARARRFSVAVTLR